MLEAYKQFSADNPAYLLMVGNPEIDALVNIGLYNWSKQQEKIIYIGSTNVVEQYLSASDCYILPSYREGFGLSVIEAQAMGLPVIVTDIPGPTDAIILNETGLVIKKADAEDLLAAMKTLYNDDEKRKSFGQNGKEFVFNNFEQTHFFEELLEDRKILLKM